MKILCLYSNECALELFFWLKEQRNDVILWRDKIDINWLYKEHFDLAISYTYPYIIGDEVIEQLNGQIINLHNSYLPFDKGTSPNIWNIIEESPRGVTIHYINSGLDTGDVIAQKLVKIDNNFTLRTSYIQLDIAVKELFKTTFVNYKFWDSMRKRCVGVGTYHKKSDLDAVIDCFDNWSYEINVEDFRQCVKSKLFCQDEKGEI